jgi:hypothetical protein
MLTLIENEEAVDRKILPLDIYAATMAFGLYDLE